VTQVIFRQIVQVQDLHYEDSGSAAIIEVTHQDQEEVRGIWVKVISWDEDHAHDKIKLAVGRRLRVTLEVLDGPEYRLEASV
jgi:hypothetical protein